MSNKKPLIFVAPLSESLQKLKEVIEEVAEDEKIEIFEVDDASEVAQLIPTVGQSLSIFGNPKKCAMVLQPNRKVIQKLNSKVILLSKKSMPRKTLDKFSKIGLTECIVEPVAPKTLLYKVRLLLRSIVVAKDEDEEEIDTSFGGTDAIGEEKAEKQRLEKGVIAEEEAIDYSMKSKSKGGLDLAADDDDEDHDREGYKEDTIQKEWKGKVNENDLSLDEEEEKKKRDLEESENYIDSYLRGKKSNSHDDMLEDDFSSKKKTQYEEEELEDYGNNKELNLDLEADEDNEETKDHDGIYESDDKYYKGKVAGEDLDLDAEDDDKKESSDEYEEEIESKRKEELLDMEMDEDEDDKNKREGLEEDEDIYEREKDFALDLEADEDDDDSSRNGDDEDEDEGPSRDDIDSALDLEAEDEDKERNGDSDLDLIEEERERPEFEKQDEESQDSHMRGKVAQVVELLDEEEIDARNRHDLEADEDDESKNSEDENSFDLEADEDEAAAKEKDLELEEGDESSKNDNGEGLELEADVDDFHDKNNGDLELIDEEDSSEDENGNGDHDDERESEDAAASLDLALEEDNDLTDKKNSEDEDGDYERRKAGLDLELDDDIERKKHSAHTEHIDTKMDSRKGIDHQDQDWDILGKKDKTESLDDEKKKKSDMQISFKEAVDLGEQTIDYRKLQNEFDAITINRVGGKRRRTGPKYYSDDMTDEEYLKGVYGEDYEEALDDIAANLKNRNDANEKTQIYHPTPQGLDEAVKVMNLYHNKALKKEDIFSYIASSILERFGGHSFFYTMNTETNELINSFALKADDDSVDSEIMEKWSSVKEEHYDEWLEHNLPKWYDEKMITEDNIFFYPIYEGANRLGFIVVLFNKLIEHSQAKSIEIILETSRGIVLDEFHKAGKSEQYDVDLTKKDEEKPKEGFFKSMFGRFSKKKAG